MKAPRFFLIAFLCLFFLISACQDEKGKDDYSGVSKLIAGRNKARYQAAKNSPEKSVSTRKRTTGKTNTSNPVSTPKKEKLSPIILYEERVEIVGSKSGRTLAKAVASINKKGQIVKIKILKE
jgi:hypothetical protein